MATTILLLYSLYLSTFFLLVHFVIAKKNGFTIELIHSDSVKSPFYPGNLTMEEKLARYYNQSNDHFNRVWARSSKIKPDLGAPVLFQQNEYTVLVGLGTFGDNPPMYTHRLFLLDTGSDQIWTQCEPCIRCFPQDTPLFSFVHSTTFIPLKCNQHPLCSPNDCDENGICLYENSYLDGATTDGYLGTEILTFESDDGQIESIPEIVIGCGSNQQNFGYTQGNVITGIFGMGHGARSFITQVANRVGGRFSYCLQPWSTDPNFPTQLRFGDDTSFNQGEQVQTTPLLTNNFYQAYFVNLLDISVGGQRLNFPPGTFAMTQHGGGCALDIGSTLTHMSRNDYNLVKDAVVKYLQGRYQEYPPDRRGDFDLCYLGTPQPLDLPEIIFHFDNNANMVVGEGAFHNAPDFFCLGIIPHDIDDVSVIIGNHLQTDHKFLYNINDLTLSFVASNCMTDS